MPAASVQNSPGSSQPTVRPSTSRYQATQVSKSRTCAVTMAMAVAVMTSSLQQVLSYALSELGHARFGDRLAGVDSDEIEDARAVEVRRLVGVSGDDMDMHVVVAGSSANWAT